MSVVLQHSKYIADDALIYSILDQAMVNDYAISLWRLPGSAKKSLIICETPLTIDDVSIEELPTGFVISPFDTKKKKIFLKADQVFEFENGTLSHSVSTEQVEELRESATSNAKPRFHSRPLFNSNSIKEAYLSLVEKAINLIASNAVEKLVPSRSKRIALDSSFDLVNQFGKLCDAYPNAFVSLISTPDTGTWLGASPELIISVDGQMKFRTTAVAGTQRFDPDTDLRAVAWTQKEIEEQALVSRYIINCFKKIRLREFGEHGPKTWKAGNLLHLKTDFEVDMNATNFPQLGSVMLKLLHPTSAICGMPREESIEFILQNEGMDRGLYSGYLGPINYKGESNLFVNLRCMQWSNSEAELYAGAGVTIDSIPEAEWEETEMKMNTLLKVIEK
ncbi:MAG: chorismate-binding protein [Cyclobacteriaceae bacterium]